MKTFLAFTLLFTLPATAASITWQDLQTGDPIYLSQSLVLPGTRGGAVRVPKNSAYVLESIEPLPGLSVVDYIFAPKRCARPDFESELTLILPEENAPDSKAEVGVYFLRGCRLEIMVETKDLRKPGLFRE